MTPLIFCFLVLVAYSKIHAASCSSCLSQNGVFCTNAGNNQPYCFESVSDCSQQCSGNVSQTCITMASNCPSPCSLCVGQGKIFCRSTGACWDSQKDCSSFCPETCVKNCNYFFSGVGYNISVNDITSGGWNVIYKDVYSVHFVFNLNTLAKYSYILIGCGLVSNSSYLSVAAMGASKKVLNVTSPNSLTFDNNVYWYYDLNNQITYGFGFSDQSYTSRNQCDLDSGNGRVCWHHSSQYGGYRCGNAVSLNYDSTWARYIYAM